MMTVTIVTVRDSDRLGILFISNPIKIIYFLSFKYFFSIFKKISFHSYANVFERPSNYTGSNIVNGKTFVQVILYTYRYARVYFAVRPLGRPGEGSVW